jgi:predicted nuclease of predicted toxin-antitoxin system
MRFLLDADVPRSSAQVLQNLGYEVIDVRDINLGAATDGEIIKYAKENNLILITRDIEFANILRYPVGSHVGIIVLRLPFDFTSKQINSNDFIKSVKIEKLANNKQSLSLGDIE